MTADDRATRGPGPAEAEGAGAPAAPRPWGGGPQITALRDPRMGAKIFFPVESDRPDTHGTPNPIGPS